MNFFTGIELLYALDQKGLLTKHLAVEMAVVYAEHVLGNVPKENRKGCQKAIKAAKDWLADPSKANRRKAKSAASAALPVPTVPAAWGASYAARTSAELVFHYNSYIMTSAFEAARLANLVSEGKWQPQKTIQILEKNGINPVRMG